MLSAQAGAWTTTLKSPHNADRRQLHPAPQPLAETPKEVGSPHADRAVMCRILPPSARGKSHAERRQCARSPSPLSSLSVSPKSPVTDEYPSRDLYSKNAYVHAGDEITVVVVPPGTTEAAVTDAWTFAVTDYNFATGAIVTWTHRDPNLPSALYGLSADAITECTPGFGCPYLGNGTVIFDSADYTDTSGES
jgi:hypothetical protein